MERTAQETAVLVGMDALRIALGKPTVNFTPSEVVTWLTIMLARDHIRPDTDNRSGRQSPRPPGGGHQCAVSVESSFTSPSASRSGRRSI